MNLDSNVLRWPYSIRQDTWVQGPHAESSEMSFLAERTSTMLRFAEPPTKPHPSSARLVVPSLPVELITRILKHVAEGDTTDWIQDMQACSLVSKGWQPLAQALLLRTVVVTDGHRKRGIGAFEHTLSHSSEMGYHVRELSLRAAHVLSRPGTPVTARRIQSFLIQLPNLSCLEISGLRFDASFCAVPFMPSYTLDQLRIVNQRSWTNVGADLLDVLRLFTGIGVLVLENVGELKDSVCFDDSFGSGFTEDMIASLHVPHICVIETLHLHSVSQMHFYLEVLKRTPAANTIRTLSVSCGHPVQVPSFAQDLGCYLSDTGMYIQQLNLELCGCFRNRLHHQAMVDCAKIYNLLLPGLSGLHSLRTFGLLILFPHDPTIPSLMWSLLVAILSSLPPTVERIQLGLQLDTYSQRSPEIAPFDWAVPWLAPQLDWEHLRRVLHKFSNLELVSFKKSYADKTQHVLCDVGAEEQELIAYHLSEFCARKILVFDTL